MKNNFDEFLQFEFELVFFIVFFVKVLINVSCLVYIFETKPVIRSCAAVIIRQTQTRARRVRGVSVSRRHPTGAVRRITAGASAWR